MSDVLEGLLGQMQKQKASDLILTVGAPRQFRINGSLQSLEGQVLRPEQTLSMARGILNDEQWTTFQARKSLDLSKGYPGLSRFRFNIYQQRDTVSLAVRIIPFKVPPFEELGLPLIIKDFASRPHGLVLITGPAGSGKSTTLAAMIQHINRDKRLHIICIEDPIEYLHEHGQSIIEQREILTDAPSFADALRSVFRQSPDVIMVGEMRDLETIRLALTLAETGHLILATLHTQDTTHAVNRIVDSFPAEQQQQIYVQLSLVLEGIVSQQLLATQDETRRVLACEVMNASNAIRNLIRERQLQQLYSVIQTSSAEGMMTMNASLKRLCERGVIAEAAALLRSPNPKDLARMLNVR